MSRRTWLTLAAIASVAGLLVVGAMLTRGAVDPEGKPLSYQGSAVTTQTGSTASTGSLGPDESTAATARADDGAPGTGTTQTPPASDDATADDGAKLTTVTVAPTQTLAVISGESAKEGDRFMVVFRPYGWASPRPAGRALVIRIDSSRRVPGNTSDLTFDAGQNMLVIVPNVVARRIGEGGPYSGLLVLHQSSGALALYLEEASAVR